MGKAVGIFFLAGLEAEIAWGDNSIPPGYHARAESGKKRYHRRAKTR
jgi:hypothetical protein